MTIGRVLRLPEVMQATGLSRSTIYDRMKDGGFPRPVRLGPNSVGWREGDVADWLASREAA
jgi:prophage regulatory protein